MNWGGGKGSILYTIDGAHKADQRGRGGLRQPFDNDFDYCKYSTRASAPAHSQDYHVCRGSMLMSASWLQQKKFKVKKNKKIKK